MNTILQEMLNKYDIRTIEDRKNAIKEIMQEIVLSGLSRAGFFKKAAFYGGTALRIFYGLDRFSEDLDFSLIEPDKNFALGDYLPILEKEVASYGLKFEIIEKEKSVDSAIKSAFVKGNTIQNMLLFYEGSDVHSIAKSEIIKIKFEIDVNPPAKASYEKKYSLLPMPYEITLYDLPSLFAGKIHAILCRAWANRVKGRDLYDYIFYLARNPKINLENLKAKLVQSKTFNETDDLTIDILKNLLKDRFDKIDYIAAKQDVLPFIKYPTSLDLWSADFFKQITDKLSN